MLLRACNMMGQIGEYVRDRRQTGVMIGMGEGKRGKGKPRTQWSDEISECNVASTIVHDNQYDNPEAKRRSQGSRRFEGNRKYGSR